MKFIRSLLTIVALLLVSSVGIVFAQEEGEGSSIPMPTYYMDLVDGQLTPTKIPAVLQPIQKEAAEAEAAQEDEGKDEITLSAGNWYWAGSSTQATPPEAAGASSTTTNNLTVSNVNIADTAGTINIVVGPNGQPEAPALTITGGLTIPSNVIVNIYQAAYESSNSSVQQPKLNQCFLRVTNNPPAVKKEESEGTTSNSGIIVNGTLNVVTGAIEGVGGSQPADADAVATQAGTAGTGVQVASTGKVTVSGGELQGTAGDDNQPGITVEQGGTLNANGGFLFAALASTKFNDPQAGTISGNFTVNGGTVSTSAAFPNNSSTQAGTWIQSPGSNNMTVTSFGTSTLSFGVYTGEDFINGEQFTVNTGANLTIPNGLQLIFGGPTSTASPNGTLTVNGTLNIAPQATVDMGTGSVLNNNGTINVES